MPSRRVNILLCTVVIVLVLTSLISVSLVSTQATQIYRLGAGKGTWAEYNVDESSGMYGQYNMGDRVRFEIVDIATETLSVQSQSLSETLDFEIAYMRCYKNTQLFGSGFSIPSFGGELFSVFYPTDRAFWNSFARIFGCQLTYSIDTVTLFQEYNTYTHILNKTTGQPISEAGQHTKIRVDVRQSDGILTRLEYRLNMTSSPPVPSAYQLALVMSIVGSSVSSPTFGLGDVSMAIFAILGLLIVVLGAVTLTAPRKKRRRAKGSTKDEILRSLSNEELLRLANLELANLVNHRTAREYLINRVKSSMSLEEIRNKL